MVPRLLALALILGLGEMSAAGIAKDSPQPRPLRDQDVIEMTRAGLADSTILLTIEANPCRFDLLPEDLIKLREQHVSDTVIHAMLEAESRRRGIVTHASMPMHVRRATFPVDCFAHKTVARGGATVDAGTLYVGRGRLRLETADRTVLIDPETLKGYVWRTGQPVEVVSSFEGVRGAPNENGLSRYLLPANPERPCAEWLNVECRRVALETLAGRSVVKWELTRYLDDDSSAISYVWVDARLHLVSKIESGGYVEELRNITEAQQPAGLFDPPTSAH
jgi:hypothetical protein